MRLIACSKRNLKTAFAIASKEWGDDFLINLKKKREEKGLTQNSLAQAVGVVRQTISNIECGLNAPSVELAKKIGEVLEFNWIEFFDE